MILRKNTSVSWTITVLIILYIAVQSYCINKLTINIDEPVFGLYGFTILKLQGNKDIETYGSKLPIVALNGIPRAFEQILHPGLEKADWGFEDFRRGRYVTLVASIMLGLLVFQWTKELYGEFAGLFSFLFYLLCPNFLTHSIFVHTDVYASLFLTACFYYLWKYHQTNKLKHFILFSLAVALAEISKFSMVFLYLLVPVLLLTRYFLGLNSKENRRQSTLVLLGIFLLINIFIISASHLFYQMFLPLKEYHFRSSTFVRLQEIFGFLPVPLPSSYVSSMDDIMYLDAIGNGTQISISNPPYILGRYNPFGFWYFYFVTLFYKIPIATLLIWLGSIIYTIMKFSRPSFFRREFYLLLPVVFYLIYLDFFYTTQLGIRHIMIILPSLFIFSGVLYSWLHANGKKWIVFLLFAYQFISVALYFPHFLPYTNEFIMDKKMVYKKLGDTNLSFNEGGFFLKSYLEKNKDAIVAPGSIMAGKIVLDANGVLGLNSGAKGKRYEFIWAKDLIPVDHIHSQFLIYDITPKMADSLRNIYEENIKEGIYKDYPVPFLPVREK